MKMKNNTEPITSQHLNALGCKLGLPVSGTFELTARCNFNCRMCYVHLKDEAGLLKKRELTADEWLDIARQARDKGLLFLLLTGGEPLIRDDFAYLYEELAKMGFMLSVNTNASLYNDKISELFRRYPPCRVNVTLYGGSEATYRALCGNASFEKVMHNLERMRTEGINLRLNVSLTPYNAADMKLIAAAAEKLGLRAKVSAYMHPPVRVSGTIGENAARFTPEEAGKVIASWYSLTDDDETFKNRTLGILRGIAAEEEAPCAEPEGSAVSCRAGRSSFWITWEGKILPCGTMNAEGVSLREKSFEQGWENVMSYTGAIRLPPECTVCRYRATCGVCASVCRSETGSFGIKPEYLCAMTKAKVREMSRIAGITGAENEDQV